MQRLVLVPLLLAAILIHADSDETDVFDPSVCLGLDLETIYETCGVPAGVYPFRGEEAWQDDVVFRFEDAYSLFIFQDRVWQVRVWGPGLKLQNVGIGDSREQVLEALDAPAGEVEGSLVFHIPDTGYPVRLRVCFIEDAVSDIYLYRADF